MASLLAFTLVCVLADHSNTLAWAPPHSRLIVPRFSKSLSSFDQRVALPRRIRKTNDGSPWSRTNELRLLLPCSLENKLHFRQPISKTDVKRLQQHSSVASSSENDNELGGENTLSEKEFEDVNSLEDYTLAELKDNLHTRDRKVSRTKSELLETLLHHQKEQEQHHLQISSENTTSSGDNNGEEEAVDYDEDDLNVDDGGATDDSTNNDDDPFLSQLPKPILESLIRYTHANLPKSSTTRQPSKEHSVSSIRPRLLPIQQQSYEVIANGGDAVLFSPTGTGKTLAYVLPLAARLYSWKRDGSLIKKNIRHSLLHQQKQQQQQPEYLKQQRQESYWQRKGKSNTDLPATRSTAATPSILVIEPSRELARQVGKVWEKFHPTATKNSKKHVVTVYGGVPMARHASMLVPPSSISSKTGSKSNPKSSRPGAAANTNYVNKVDVLVGTPGRIRELLRENYLSTSNIRSIVLDEADTLLNFQDVPEVQSLLEGMDHDYQLILASATVNERVEKFVGEVMELEEQGGKGYITVGAGALGGVGGGRSIMTRNHVEDENDVVGFEGAEMEKQAWSGDSFQEESKETYTKSPSMPTIRHYSLPSSRSTRTSLTSDLIITMAPRRAILFVDSKAEVELVAQQLSEKLGAGKDVSVHVLHGDMVQSARSRTVMAFRGDVHESSPVSSLSLKRPRGPRSRITRILVATDVASRGLDLPAVDLVLQYGVPRKNGKDGTFDPELYIHRTGRAGRYSAGNNINNGVHGAGIENDSMADAIVFYDVGQGEKTTVSQLTEEMKEKWGVEIEERNLPTPSDVMEAYYERAFWRCEEFGKNALEGTPTRGGQANGSGEETGMLIEHFTDRLMKDLSDSKKNDKTQNNWIGEKEDWEERELFLLRKLATAMAALSGLEEAVPQRSLLTADPRDRTIRVYTDSSDSENPLSPPVVTKLVKGLGSGKLGRISICDDGSAVFDLGTKKANRLLKSVDEKRRGENEVDIHGWHFEFPKSLPAMSF